MARLSEVAEQLQRRAAMYVESGKEDDARGLLSMKKKIMVGLNKSKNRTELFEKLATKLDQAGPGPANFQLYCLPTIGPTI